MRKTYFSFSLLLFCLICIFMSGCSGKKTAAEPSIQESKRITIGFSLDSLIVERWIRDRDVFVAAAGALGADVIFQNAANDAYEQVNQVKYLVDSNVDVLVIIPQYADLLSDIVQKARTKGIKVISYDRLIRNANVDLYISVNSIEVGKLMAEAVAEKVPAGNYAFINGPQSDYNVNLMRQGFDSVLRNYPDVTRACDFFAENWSYDKAFEQASFLLDAGIPFDAVICGNDGLAGGVIRALSEHRIAGTIPVVGQDADIAACQHIAEGLQLMTVYKPISELARTAAAVAVQMASGAFVFPEEKINDGTFDVPVYWIPPVAVTRENMDDIIIDSGFHTAEEVYRYKTAVN
ncbi:substrate-binding domain-containing protein [Brucepastera parasyntrophica]|uniref:sugar ABC transporter substrate-binding protein n=1 Tax=Brucepastera parasyntrophica TaxID=2880008 RepID=UPI00210E33FA|nr:substrate-binding domain-containing protein [Brucepastera parasyntrophica]ULQ60859.1 substrate-binding domain-containing protein [Brucepastera parasyntrophica]